MAGPGLVTNRRMGGWGGGPPLVGVVGMVWGANQLCCPSLANESGTSRAMAGMHILYHNNFLVSPRNSFYSRPKTNILLCNFEDVFQGWRHIKLKGSFSILKSAISFFYPEWVSCVCAALIRKREEVERWKRELISNQIQKPLDIFQITTTIKSYANCVCPASVRAVPFQRVFCRILTRVEFRLGMLQKTVL